MTESPQKFEDLTARQQEFLTCKPSRLIEMAIEDLQRLSETEGYKVDMSEWVSTYYSRGMHAYRKFDAPQGFIESPGTKKVCYVCLGGAALIGCGYNEDNWMSIDMPVGVLEPIFDGYSHVGRARVIALNEFRTGNVGDGIFTMNQARMPGQPAFEYSGNDPSHYETEPWGSRQFYSSLHGLINFLKFRGL